MDGHANDAVLTRRSLLKLLGGSVVVALAGTWRARPTETPVIEDPSPIRWTGERTYRGTARTVVDGVDRPGGDGVRRSFESEIAVTVGEPLAVGGGEKNPFHLALDSEDGEGPIRVVSASVLSSESDGETLFHHWTLELDRNGAFAGVIAPRSPADPGVVNLVASYQELVPGLPETVLMTAEAMGDGTFMTGTVDDEALRLLIEGSTENTFAAPEVRLRRTFATEVRADRID